MEIIILAGGFGTRLQSVVHNVPKPMAPINEKPFLEYLLEYLSRYTVTKIIFSVGFKEEVVKKYFHNSYKNIEINYSSEENPLGTGGAIKKALEYIDSDRCLVLNGDSFFDIDIDKFCSFSANDAIAIAIKPMINFDRYGAVEVKDGKITSFIEKTFTRSGYINSGVYSISKNIFKYIEDDIFSFEHFLQNQKNIVAYIEDGYFIDIGIPLDYDKAKIDFRELF